MTKFVHERKNAGVADNRPMRSRGKKKKMVIITSTMINDNNKKNIYYIKIMLLINLILNLTLILLNLSF